MFHCSPALEIFSGDGGSAMGNAILAAISDAKTKLQTKAFGVPSVPVPNPAGTGP